MSDSFSEHDCVEVQLEDVLLEDKPLPTNWDPNTTLQRAGFNPVRTFRFSSRCCAYSSAECRNRSNTERKN
jgi:hypothetical protein